MKAQLALRMKYRLKAVRKRHCVPHGSGARARAKLMGGKLQMNDARSTSDLKAPLCGFFHIRNGALLCQQLNQLRELHESAE